MKLKQNILCIRAGQMHCANFKKKDKLKTSFWKWEEIGGGNDSAVRSQTVKIKANKIPLVAPSCLLSPLR